MRSFLVVWSNFWIPPHSHNYTQGDERRHMCPMVASTFISFQAKYQRNIFRQNNNISLPETAE